jgi:hypothetical protein
MSFPEEAGLSVDSTYQLGEMGVDERVRMEQLKIFCKQSITYLYYAGSRNTNY